MRFISEAQRVIYDGITIGTNDFLRGHFLLAESQRSNFHLFGAKAAILSHRVAPHFIWNTVTRNYHKQGLDVLGLGYHSIVLGDGTDRVRKIHHRTLHMLPERRNAYIDRLNRKQSLLREFFPDPMIKFQEFAVEEFPLNPSLPVVVAKQPRVYGEFLTRDQVLTNDLVTAPSKEMHDQARTLPDIVGSDNMLIPQGAETPVLIDTIPLSQHDPNDYAAYRVACEIMHEALDVDAFQEIQSKPD